MEFINYTSYNKAEDIKRLKFITLNLPQKNETSLRILEIGCGNGNISYQLARSGHHVTGIDISSTTIYNAVLKYGMVPNLEFKVADAEHLQLENNQKFDVIVCSEVLEHLFQPEKLVQNFKNLLLNNGVVIVTVPNGYGPREAIITKPVKYILNSKGYISKLTHFVKSILGYKGNNAQTSAENLDHIQFFTIKKLSILANSGGFKIIRKQAGNFVENVFPYSLFTRKFYFLQKLDCVIADILPLAFTSAFYTVWKLKI